MNLMICMRGEPEQLPYLPQIAELGAGIELGSYGLIGIQSERDWERRVAQHKALRAQFQGTIAIHGPFIGMEYTHIDHLIREVVKRRLDMTLEAALELKASRVVLHGGYKPEIDLFNLQESWLEKSIEFWGREIRRWQAAGILVVLENDIEESPDLLVRLVNAVDNPYLGLCWMRMNGYAGWKSGFSIFTCTTMTGPVTAIGRLGAAPLISSLSTLR
jgi:sugar phosphate isomerase/epimerase